MVARARGSHRRHTAPPYPALARQTVAGEAGVALMTEIRGASNQ
jgi:hypothetical protein